MQYIDEGQESSSQILTKPETIRTALTYNGADSREHNIKDFLSRPIPLTNFEWTVSNSQFTTLYTAEFPDAVLTNNMYAPKFTGFLGIRAALQFRLQINSQPFQAGRIIMAWVPYYKYLGSRVQVFDTDTLATMTALSGCPHVDFDISQNTTASFTVPFVSPQSFFNLATGEGYYGKLYIKVYSPLVDLVGGGQVDCTLWFNFVDPELAFPTGTAPVTASRNPVAQVGKEERQLEQTRSVSSALSKFSSALSSLPSYPPLDSILQPASWASDRAAEVLKLFGLSKPESTNIPNYIKQSPCRFLPNSDGVNLSHSLGLLSNNAVEGMPDMVAEGTDEMNISHIVSTPSFLERFSWTTSQPIGTNLWSKLTTPALYYNTETASSTLVPTHLAFVTNAFSFWRGSIIFTFKFVKTKFHSGRARLFFQPGAGLFTPLTGNLNYSQVIDLRSETEVRFSVPYVCTRPWTKTSPTAMVIPGIVHLEVLNDLKAASTVSNTIDVLVEVSAGEDFELAAPQSPMIQPVNITPSTLTRSKKLLNLIKAQVGEVETREDEQQNLVNEDQLGSKIPRTAWALNLAMHGEKVVSLRQLLKRASAVSTFASTGSMILAPFNPNLNYSRLATDSLITQKMSYLDYFSNIFAFWRGAVNIKLVPTVFATTRARVEAILSLSDPGHSIPFPSLSTIADISVPIHNNKGLNPVQVVFQDIEGCIDLMCPYYSEVHMSPVSDYTFRDGNIELCMQPPYLVSATNLVTGSYDIYRSATDAYQLGYLIGTPRCETVPIA